MLTVGLSGGIGSGKSTVSSRLAEHGAVLIDSDVLAREAVEIGSSGLDQIRARFGDKVIGPDGGLDRPALGRVVFGDGAARSDLNAIVHPRVQELTRERMAQAPDDAVVVHDIPLLVELDRGPDYQLVVIVGADEQTRRRRLVEVRGMSEDDARARIAAQANDQQRRAAADVWLPNETDVADLHAAVDALWIDRLVPFEANLRAHTPARWESGRAERASSDAPESATAERVRRRIERQLEAAGLSSRIEPRGADVERDSTVDEVGKLRIIVHDLDAARTSAFENALLAAGFVSHDSSPDAVVYRSADPGRPMELQVSAGR